MALFMAKVVTKGYDAPAWFFVTADDPESMAAKIEDSETRVVGWVQGEEAISRRLKLEFDNLALVANV